MAAHIRPSQVGVDRRAERSTAVVGKALRLRCYPGPLGWIGSMHSAGRGPRAATEQHRALQLYGCSIEC
jgi:hypothetical protein